jgi:hypothetical protein
MGFAPAVDARAPKAVAPIAIRSSRLVWYTDAIIDPCGGKISEGLSVVDTWTDHLEPQRFV